MPAAIDAIVTALQGTGLTVWDGPIVTGNFNDAVYIAFDGDYDGEERAAFTDQQWAGIGQRRRDETSEITCAVVALVGEGNTSWKPARDRIAAQLEIVGQKLRSDPTLGPSLGLTPPSVAELVPGELFQENGPSGFQARLLFTINYKTRV